MDAACKGIYNGVVSICNNLLVHAHDLCVFWKEKFQCLRS